MRRTMNRLSAVAVRQIETPGMYADGGGLYLQMTGVGVKSWTFRFMRDGRERYMGLGPLHTIGLAEARQRAQECRRIRLDGHDPIEVRRAGRLVAKLDAAKAVTFRA